MYVVNLTIFTIIFDSHGSANLQRPEDRPSKLWLTVHSYTVTVDLKVDLLF